MAQSVWPWQRSGSTRTFMASSCRVGLSAPEVVGLEVAAAIDAQLHAGDVARLVGGEEQHGVADVNRLDPGDRHGLHGREGELGVRAGRMFEILAEGLVHRLA